MGFSKDCAIRADASRSDLDSLKELILDAKCLDGLSKHARELNFFEVAGIARLEIKHSNVLAWLLDPLAQHRMGDALFRELLTACLEEEQSDTSSHGSLPKDFDDLVVLREWRNIDLLAYSESNGIALCIENKTGTTEHDNQLARYLGVVEKRFPEFERHYLYLTPGGDASSNPDVWKPVSYARIARFLDRALYTYDVPEEPALLISHYIKTVRRHVLKEDDEIAQLCKSIYRKHRRALDLIYENRPDLVADVDERISDWLVSNHFDLAKCDKGCTRFILPELDSLIGRSDDGMGGFDYGILAAFAFNAGDSDGDHATYPYFTFYCSKDSMKLLRPDVQRFREALLERFGFKANSSSCWSAVGNVSAETTDVAEMGDREFDRFMNEAISSVRSFEQELEGIWNICQAD